MKGRLNTSFILLGYILLCLYFIFFTISYLLSDYDLRSFDDEIDYTSAKINAIKEDDLLSLIPDSTRIQLLNDSLVSQFADIKDFNVLYDSIESKFGEDFIKNTEISLKTLKCLRRKENLQLTDTID